MNKHSAVALQPAAASGGECSGWFDSAARGLIKAAARSAPAAISERLREEWLADLGERTNPLARLKFGLGCLWAAIVIAHDGSTGTVLVSAVPVQVPVLRAAAGNGRPLYSRNEFALEAPTICDINTTPLIDILLVLLITLILSLPLLTHAVKIDLPQATTTQQITPPEVIDLEIYFDGTVVWNGTPVASSRQLEGYFGTEARKPIQPEIRLRPNGHVRYDVVAKVLGAAQRSGVQKVGFANTGEFGP